MLMPSIKDDDYDRRLRLVSLAYEVLQSMKLPDDATDAEMLSLLSREFSDRATVQPTLEAPANKPPSKFSKPRMETSRLRRAVSANRKMA